MDFMTSNLMNDFFTHRLCRVFSLMVVFYSQSLIHSSHCKLSPLFSTLVSAAVFASYNHRISHVGRGLQNSALGNQSESLQLLRFPWADSRLSGHQAQSPTLFSYHSLLEDCWRLTSREVTSFESFCGCYILYYFLVFYSKGNFHPLKLDQIVENCTHSWR